MNPNDPVEAYWSASSIKNVVNFDDEDENVLETDSSPSNKDDALSLSDAFSKTSLSERSNIQRPKVELYSLMSEASVQYILNEHTFLEDKCTFQPNESKGSIKSTINSLSKGSKVCLEHYKSLSSKKELLKQSIALNNNDVILKVVIFLVKTLNTNLMHEIFINEPKALDNYVNFFISKNDVPKAVELLDRLALNRDAAMLQFQLCCAGKMNQASAIRSIGNTYLLNNFEKCYFDNLVNLIEWQTSVYKRFDQSSSTHCLAYIINKKAPQSPISDEQFCKLVNINDKLYHFVFLKEKCKSKSWNEVSQKFLSKKWHGSMSLNTSVPIEDIVRELAANDAPESELVKYLRIMDLDDRLLMARKYKCLHTVVDILVEQRDKQALLAFKFQQPNPSKSFYYAETALRNNSVKWKN